VRTAATSSKCFTRIRTEADNATGPGNAGAAGRLTGYLEWAARSAPMLHNRIKAADIDRLILTRGYDRLLAAAGSLTGTDTSIQRVLNDLIDMELRLVPRHLTRSSATCGARTRSGAPTIFMRYWTPASISSTTTSSKSWTSPRS
jgi:hypothetical protein